MGEWQPIGTAPKDGTEIIILLDGHAVSAKWFDAKAAGSTEYTGAGWVTLESREGYYTAFVPEGWMPFPDPPEPPR